MSTTALFWTGFGLTAVAIAGLALAVCRAAALADEDTQRALRQERAARAGLYPRGDIQASPLPHPSGGEEPRASIFSPARGATTCNGHEDVA